MKTLILSLVFLLTTTTTAFAAESKEVMLTKAQLIRILSAGLPQGAQQGVSSEGDACTLTANYEKGKEQLSMQSTADIYDQRLLFDKEFESILFKVIGSDNSLQINQDFDDSYQDVKIEKLSSSVRMTFTEYIGGDTRILTCTFK